MEQDKTGAQNNPGDQDRDARIRARAYALWEKDGGSHGSHERHWQDAERELYGNALVDGGAHELEPENAPAGTTPDKAAKVDPVAPPRAEPAAKTAKGSAAR